MSKHNYDRAVMRGVAYNLLGVLGQAFTPIFFIVVGRVYGAAALGTYLLMYTFIEMLKRLAIGGLNDGIMIYVARYLVREDGEKQVYQALANSIALCLSISLLVLCAIHAGLTGFLPVYGEEQNQELLRLMVIGLPLQAFAVLLVSATKATVEMKWAALMGGFIRPFGLFFFAALFAFFDLGLVGLAYGYIATGIVMLVPAMIIFLKHFSLKKCFHAFKNFRVMKELMYFVIPQNLNLTFNDVIAGFDVIMLGFFGVKPALIGYYGVAAQIVVNIEQVRMAFAGAYAPVIARLYSQKLIARMNVSFNKVSRWTMLAAFPLGFTAIFFRSELLQLFHPAFGVPFALPLEELVSPALIACLQFEYLYEMGLTGFMIILTIVPLLSCGIGLAGNVITMTGHSGWNLFNSGVTAGLGIVTAALLIPEWGIFGAALAAAVSAVLIRSLQLVEVRFLIGVRLSPSRLYKPYLAALISGIFLFGLEPLTHGRIYWRVPLLLFSLAVYFIILKKLGLEDGDAKILLPWKKKPK